MDQNNKAATSPKKRAVSNPTSFKLYILTLLNLITSRTNDWKGF